MDHMKETMSHKRAEERQTRWPTWRIVVAALAVAFLFAPAAIVTPHHTNATAPIPASHTKPVQPCVGSMCSQTVISIRAAVEQASLRLPITPLLLLVTIALICIVWQQSDTRTSRADGWWPLGRRRALLQVFLI